MGSFKYSTWLWALGGASDRFPPSGYGDREVSLGEVIRIAGSVDGIEGVEIISSRIDGMDLRKFKSWFDESKLARVDRKALKAAQEALDSAKSQGDPEQGDLRLSRGGRRTTFTRRNASK